jgi:hypothetical protein
VRTELVETGLPANTDMATISRLQNGVKITGTPPAPPAPPPPPALPETPPVLPETVDSTLAKVTAADKWAVDSVHVIDNGRSLAAAIMRGDARAVSDGSFKNAMGTSLSTLFHFSAKDPNRIVSVNAVPGNRDEQSAYRSELAGISGSLAVTAAVCRIHDIQAGSITFGLDGRQALLAAAGDWPLNPERPDFDLITDIRVKLRKLPVTVHWKWVEGHQDDDKTSHLDEWA